MIICDSVNDHFVGDRVHDRLQADATVDRIGQTNFDLFAAIDDTLGDPLRGPAVFHRDHNVLGHVGQLAGQVTAVSGFQCRVGQTLSSTVRGTEVLQHRQAFAEVGLNRRFDDFAGRFRHQTSHSGQAGESVRYHHEHPSGTSRTPG